MTLLDAEQLAKANASAMWVDDKASRGMGMELTHISPGSARLTMTVREDMVNGHNICHGGFIFTLADSAFAYACNSHNYNAVAAGARIEFLAAGRFGDVLTATSEQVTQGKRTGIYDGVVTNQEGKTLALFRGNAHRIGGALVDESTGERLA